MKAARGIMLGIAIACIAGIIGFTAYGTRRLFIFGVSGGIYCEIFLELALAMLCALCIITLIQRSREGGKRLLLWIETFMFLISLIYWSLPVLDDLQSIKHLQEMKSPDGKHSLYYIEGTDEISGEVCKV